MNWTTQKNAFLFLVQFDFTCAQTHICVYIKLLYINFITLTNWGSSPSFEFAFAAQFFNTELWFFKLFKNFQLYFVCYYFVLLWCVCYILRRRRRRRLHRLLFVSVSHFLFTLRRMQFSSCNLASASFLTCHQNVLWIWLNRFSQFAFCNLFVCVINVYWIYIYTIQIRVYADADVVHVDLNCAVDFLLLLLLC